MLPYSGERSGFARILIFLQGGNVKTALSKPFIAVKGNTGSEKQSDIA